MSAKSLDGRNRWRCKSICFRMSPEEAEQLDRRVAVSGLTKQEYLVQCCLQHDVTVQGNTRVHKALKGQMEQLVQELRRCSAGERADGELLETARFVAAVWERMKG